ncbi:NADH-ubiquinone oxidoreductase-F iron-sulfur binding region domain-containing protein [Tautonia plasticadhaerens]|uniref:NADH-quinone oxidoreductase subunit 1 n=1 Tax=Tautonia plasticadhaerens TaxID=2527974 RepID=A0A518H8I0_9BACT|nr:NADH-quinone oxidoreductase subunit 1 [Tautonia plasticadhaerens]
MIVQELNALQQRCGFLPDEELRALSRRIDVPLHRLHEVASFFPHYRLKKGPEVEVRVCRDVSCHLRGAEQLRDGVKALANEIDPTGKVVEVEGVSCLGQCDHAPAVTVNDRVDHGLSEQDLRSRVHEAVSREPPRHRRADRGPLGWKIDPYDGNPRDEAVRKLVETRDPRTGSLSGGIDDLLEQLKISTLRGMGGARFPTHLKWAAVRAQASDVKYVVCNGDESEPGTFKDRELLRRAPHLLVEGMVLAGLTGGATKGYIYIRHEYHEEIEAVEDAIREATARGACGTDILGSGLSFPVEVFVSPGGYICGEESALLEAMEDRRAEPRNKPPFPTVAGLFNKPTIINNVETLMWTPSIYLKGGEWYRDQGINACKGLWFCSISGDVRAPGVYEVPFGVTVRDLIYRRAGGMSRGQRLRAVAPSGPSGGLFPPLIRRDLLPEAFAKAHLPDAGAFFDLLDLPLDPDIVRGMGGMLGAAFVAVGEHADLVGLALNLSEFFRNESCGKCVPCRVGSQKLVEMIRALRAGQFDREHLELARSLGNTMILTSICGLGQVAPNPLLTLAKYFPEEIEALLDRRGGPPAREFSMFETIV